MASGNRQACCVKAACKVTASSSEVGAGAGCEMGCMSDPSLRFGQNGRVLAQAKKISGVGGHLMGLVESYPAGRFVAFPGIKNFVSECRERLDEFVAVTDEIGAARHPDVLQSDE